MNKAITLTGQCLCGNITYTCTAKPSSMQYCHCDNCRRVTGSAFNIGVGMPKEALKIKGKIQSYTHQAQEGHQTTREFCPTCGTPLWTRGNQTIWIRAGTLNNTQDLYPTGEIWTEMAVPWSRIPTEIPSYPQTKTTGV